MGKVFIDLNTKIAATPVATFSTNESRFVGSVISDDMFGVNFLSAFENGTSKNIETYAKIIRALGGGDDSAATMTVTNIRFPGGALTEKFYANPKSEFTIDTSVNYNKSYGISARDFIAMCDELGSNMTQVIPTWRYLDTGGLTSADRVEIGKYVKSLLAEALDKGVAVNAFELGNEYWGGMTVGKTANVAMSASQYGAIAAQQAEVIAAAITQFTTENRAAIAALPDWASPKILLQMGSPSGDVANIGRMKAQLDSQAIIDAFETPSQRAAIDGFIVHRYETTIDHVRDPYVLAKPMHMQALPDMLTDAGWKPFDSMTLAVTEWNLDQNSQETGLRSYATVVAMMGEFASLGVDAADFWSAAARSNFPLARFEGGQHSPNAEFLGLSFTGEAFRMMKES